MTSVGISGHQEMPEEASVFATQSFARLLPRPGGLVGYSSLAKGADQLFAEYVLDLGVPLRVVLPCAGYETAFKSAPEKARFRFYLSRAVAVETLNFAAPSEKAFFAAGRAIVDACDWLIAVWDGQPAQGLGGTADVVSYAVSLGRRVEVVWPAGATR